jgi:microcystin degradation protein MlrC
MAAGYTPGAFLAESGPTGGNVIDEAAAVAPPSGGAKRTSYVLVEVLVEVAAAACVPLDPGGERIHGAITHAGSSKAPAY